MLAQGHTTLWVFIISQLALFRLHHFLPRTEGGVHSQKHIDLWVKAKFKKASWRRQGLCWRVNEWNMERQS